MKHAIKLLRNEARDLRWRMESPNSRHPQQGELATEYESAAELLEKLSAGADGHGPNQVAPAVLPSADMREHGLLTAALFVGINPKAAHQLVEFVKYIQNLEAALQEKNSE